jgi:endonuclease YncB( thermonuclease family)
MKIWIILLLVFPLTALSAVEFGDVAVDRVNTVIDGDSFKVTIDKWPGIIGKSVTVRINGVDTPEMRGKCDKEKLLARKAKQFAVGVLRAGDRVELRNMKRGKYFRIVADVYVDGISLGDQLLSADLARLYEGGKRKVWCDL